MTVPILVPRRADNGRRDELWDWCQQRWAEECPDLKIVEGHHDDGPFNRAAAINQAARDAGDWDVAVIADSDITIAGTQVEDAIQCAHATHRLVIAYRFYRMLDPQSTTKLMRQPGIDRRRLKSKKLWDSCSGCIVVPRGLWDELGGFDERFVGWGWEDVAFALAADTIGGRRYRIDGDIWHLWHPITKERTQTSELYQANKVLAEQRYAGAYMKPDAMRELLTGTVTS